MSDDLTPAAFALSNHCECAAPMVVLVDAEDTWRGGHHDPERETATGLARLLDEHHLATLCGCCDGTEKFNVTYHYSTEATPWEGR